MANAGRRHTDQEKAVMPIYEIEIPGQGVFEVEAPDGADLNAVAAQVGQMYGEPQSGDTQPAQAVPAQPTPSKQDYQPGAAERAGAALQGLTLGFGDEIVAAGTAGLMKLLGADAAQGKSFSDVYRGVKDTIDYRQDEFKENRPLEALAYETGGGMLTGGAAAGKVLASEAVKNAPKAAKAAAVAGIGATEGAIYGAGSADEGERLEGAAVGAGTGAIAAPLGAGVAKAVGTAAKPAVNLARNLTEGADAQAKRYLRNISESADLDADSIGRRAEELGADAMLADTSPAMKQAARAVADSSPAAANTLEEALTGRQVNNTERLIGKLEASMGAETGDLLGDLDVLKAQRAARAAPLYEEAFTMPATDSLKKMASRDSVAKALRKGESLASDLGEEISEAAPLQKWHYAKMALDDQIGSAYRQGAKSEARAIIKARNDMLDAMDAASPAYKKARAQYAGDSELLSAADLGSTFFKMDAYDIANATRKMGESEKEFFKRGALKAITDQLDKGVSGDASMMRKLSKVELTKKLKPLFGGDAEVKRFIDSVDIERGFSDTKNRVLGGSRTSTNQEAIEMLKSGGSTASSATGAVDMIAGGLIDRYFGSGISEKGVQQAAKYLSQQGLNQDQINKIFLTPRIQRIMRGEALPSSVGAGAVIPSVDATNYLYEERQ